MLQAGKALKSSFVKNHSLPIDNVVFRLHYKVTGALLLIFCGIVSIEDYYKGIKCTHSDPTDSKKALEHVIETYCFFMATFTVTRHHNLTTGAMAYSGVGPHVGKEDTTVHAYYQWVPYVLFLQFLFFYLPHFLWRTKEGGRLKEIVGQFTFEKMYAKFQENNDDEKKEKKVEKVYETQRKFYVFFNERIKLYGSWLKWLVTFEILNLVNLIVQVFITDKFLGGNFFKLGGLVYQYHGSAEYNPYDAIFPKVSKCTFQKYGSSGSLQTHDAVCILSKNILLEKMYLVLWYWYIFLFGATALMVTHRILSFAFYRRYMSYNISIFKKEMVTASPSRRTLEKIMLQCSYSEWFFLQTLVSHLDGETANDLLLAMADPPIEPYSEKTRERVMEHFLLEEKKEKESPKPTPQPAPATAPPADLIDTSTDEKTQLIEVDVTIDD